MHLPASKKFKKIVIDNIDLHRTLNYRNATICHEILPLPLIFANRFKDQWNTRRETPRAYLHSGALRSPDGFTSESHRKTSGKKYVLRDRGTVFERMAMGVAIRVPLAYCPGHSRSNGLFNGNSIVNNARVRDTFTTVDEAERTQHRRDSCKVPRSRRRLTRSPRVLSNLEAFDGVVRLPG